MTVPSPASLALDAPDDWIPADQRWLGMDRRARRPAIIVALLAIVMILLIPAIDAAIPAGRPVMPGERIGLTGGVQFTPADGWTITDGDTVDDPTRAGGYPATATLTRGPVTMTVTAAKYSGTADQLLAQLEQNAQRNGDPARFGSGVRPVRTSDGVSGAAATITTVSSTGLLVALIVDGVGVEVAVTAPQPAGQDLGADVDAMLASFSPIGGER